MSRSINQTSIVQEGMKFFLVIALVIVSIIFGIMQPNFFHLSNIMDIFRTASITGIVALGCMVIMATGELNWAIGAQFTMAAGIVGQVMANSDGKMYVPAIILAFAAVMITGLATGFFVIKIGVPSFIASLAMNTFLSGFNKLLTGNGTFYSPNWGGYFTTLGQSYLFKVIPMPVVIFVIVAVVFHFFYEFTPMGRQICGIGANPIASRQVGINTNRLKYLAFALSALLCGLAGIIQSSVSKNVALSAGSEELMPALCTAMLGATFLKPGKYNVPGVVVASILMILIDNGVVSTGGSFYVKDLIQGIICLIAVGIISVVRTEGLPKVSFGS